MNKPFHLSLGVKSIDDSVSFFQETLNASVTYQEESYTNIEVFGHQITLKPNSTIDPQLQDFHFGFNMSLEEFNQISNRVLSMSSKFVKMEPKVVDSGTPMERKKMYLQSPTGYIVELKGYQ
ncbi:MAG: hypothetical protein HRT44_05600 [Bdellovibrionales bacterium]|nr:hypothetical protein [Bdellovibrionales bacterium]NQZ18718.1 hypothetical protein [Bdellovibrionales bacterium]